MSLCNVTSLRQMLKPQGQLFPLPSLSSDLLQDRAVIVSSQPVHLHLITSGENQLLLLIRNEHRLKSCEYIYADVDVYIYAGFCDLLPWQMCVFCCVFVTCILAPVVSLHQHSTLWVSDCVQHGEDTRAICTRGSMWHTDGEKMNSSVLQYARKQIN